MESAAHFISAIQLLSLPASAIFSLEDIECTGWEERPKVTLPCERVTTSATALHWLCHMPLHCLAGKSHQIDAACNTPRALPHPEFNKEASGQRSSLLSQLGLPGRGDATCHRLHCTSLAGACGPG